MAEISSCQANYLFIDLIPGLGRGVKDFFLFFSFFLLFFLFSPFLTQTCSCWPDHSRGRKVELLNMKKEIYCAFFSYRFRNISSFFNLRDVSVLGGRRKHVDA